MAELRAPDPTLTSLGVTAVIVQQGAVPPRAHRIVGRVAGDYDAACVLRSHTMHHAEHARWFAVPCRECFPDAPPPGHTPCNCPHPDHVSYLDHGLAWQVTS